MMTIIDPVELAKCCEGLWAGEIFLKYVDRDGMMRGYDIELMKNVVNSINIPVIALVGAGNVTHVSEVIQ